MKDEFISESISPVIASMDTSSIDPGEPGFPARFEWRGEEYFVLEVLAKWKESGPCSHGGGEQYLRKHWYHVKTHDGQQMKLYFQRQKRGPSRLKGRWCLYSRSRFE